MRKTASSSTPRSAPLHLFAAAGFALAQPLFAVLGQQPAFFTARGSQASDVLLFAAAAVLLLPLALVCVEAIVGLLDRRLRQALHLAFIALLVAATALPPLKHLALPAWPTVALAAATGAAVAWAYDRSAGVRSFFTVLSPAPLVFALLFLLHSPVAGIVRPPAEVGSAGVRIRHPSPVVLVVFDEFNSIGLMNAAGEIDAERYPSFARLARSGTWYRNATTVNENSEVAVPAILTGRYPDRERLPTFADYPDNLFTLLGGAYEMHVYETLTQLCPPNLCGEHAHTAPVGPRLLSLVADAAVVELHILLPGDLAQGLPSIAAKWGDFAGLGAAATPAKRAAPGRAARGRLTNPKGWITQALRDDRPLRFEELVADVQPSGRPSLYFLHSLLPHVSWRYLPSGQDYSTVGDELLMEGWSRATEDWTGNPWTVVQGQQRYLLQVGFADHLVGELIAKLESEGMFDDTLLVITADHGVSFVPHHSRRGIDDATEAEILSVPLFVKAPHQGQGRIDDRNVQTIDVLPLIAEILGVEPQPAFDGRGSGAPEPDLKVAVVTRDKQLRRLEFDPRLPARQESLRRQTERFGTGPAGLFRIGPRDDLVGRTVSEEERARGGAMSARIANPGLYEAVDPSGPFLPVQVSGELESGEDSPDPLVLAVAVNGRVEATTYAIGSGGQTRFSAIVRPEALRAGSNEIEVYLATGEGTATTLQRCTPRAYRWDAARGALVDPAGEVIDLRAGVVSGSAVLRQRHDGRASISGWAADLRNREVAAMVFAFVDDRLVMSVRPGSANPDAGRRSPAVRMSGWGLDLPLDDLDPRRLRVIAVSARGEASQLTVSAPRPPPGSAAPMGDT